MIFHSLYFLIVAILFWWFEFPVLWIATMLIVSNVYNAGHMIVKEIKKK